VWFSRQQDGFRGWFAVANAAGDIFTLIPTGSFLITVRNPQDTASSLPSVTESGKLGLYRFDVTSSFMLTHGVGEYAVVIEINKTTAPKIKDVLSHVLSISQNDFDSLTISLSSSSISTIVSGVWNENLNSYSVTGSAGALLVSASLGGGGSTSINYTAVANAVWDEPLSGHQTSGSSGFIVSQMSGTLETISTTTNLMQQMGTGRWKIETNQMIFYRDDNVTEVMRFNLFDEFGAPTMDAVFERVKV